MKSLIYTLLTIVSFNLFISCSGFNLEEEIPYDFEFQEQVFVTGLLTNESGFITLDIQKTIPADSSGFNPVNDALVSLYTRENSNSDAVLITDSFSVANGTYTSSEELSPIEGNRYWTEIILDDGTTLKSEEEILKTSIDLSVTDIENTTRITIEDPNDEENFYLIYTEFYEGDNFISDNWYLIDDINDDSEIYLTINNQSEGVTFKMNLYNINFNTFQFYNNSLIQLDNEVDIFFSPLRNLYGNITDITNNKVALGNFGIAGYSYISMEF